MDVWIESRYGRDEVQTSNDIWTRTEGRRPEGQGQVYPSYGGRAHCQHAEDSMLAVQVLGAASEGSRRGVPGQGTPGLLLTSDYCPRLVGD